MIDPIAWPALSALEALFYAVGGMAAAAATRLPRWPLWVAAIWVGVELLRGTVPFGGFPWGRLGFAVVDTPVLPSVAYVGVPGATFLVALVGATAAWWALEGRRRPVRGAAVLGLAMALSVVAALLPQPGAPGPTEEPATAQVAVVQGNVPGIGLDAFSERRAVLDNHVEATLELADEVAEGGAPQPDLVIWPENSSDIDPTRDASVEADVAEAARAVGVPLLMGAAVGDRQVTGWHNRAILWSAQGEPVDSYDKRRPVPFGEYIPLRGLLAPLVPALDQIPTDMIRGDRPGVLEVGPIAAGVVMCFEVAYDAMFRDLVEGGANLVVVPTNNATYTGTAQVEQQFAMSRVRAVETGRYVVVASTNGISGVLAADGSVVVRAVEQTTIVLDEGVQLRAAVTPAVRVAGTLELVLALAGLVSLLAGAALGYRRRSRVEREA